jgi:hypothetical protein
MNTLGLKEYTNAIKLNKLIHSDLINKTEKAQLTKYKKQIANRQVSVYYEFARDCYGVGNHGRIFANNSLSLQSFRKEIRHTLAEEFYVDIDIVNAHPNFLQQLCEQHKWEHKCLAQYIEKREEVLNELHNHYSITVDNAKKSILTIINGGEGLDDSHEFISKFKKEMKAVRDNLMNAEQDLVKYVNDKRRKKTTNLGGSVISIKLCDIENSILMSMMDFFRSKQLTIGVLVFDGLMLEKNHLINDDLLDECCEYVNEKLGWRIKLAIKPMTMGFDLSIFDKEDYDNVKKQFEIDVAKVNQSDMFIRCIGEEITLITPAKLKHTYNNLWCYYNGERKKFLKLWLDDPTIRTYEKVDFLPYPRICSDDTFNLFTGLEGSKLRCKEGDIDHVLLHIKKLTGNNEASFMYFMKWLADMVQRPGKLNGVAVVFKSEQGAGKNIFLDFFGNKILGKEYFFSTCEFERLVGTFANGRKNKILINMDETSGKESFSLSEKIKSFITEETLKYEQKGIDSITLNNFARWIFTTNNDTPIKIELSDRRFVVFECDSSVCKNTKYFKELASVFNDDQVACSFYKALMDIDLSDFDPINDRPITEVYKDIQGVNIPDLFYFVDFYMNSFGDADVEVYPSNVYPKYKQFCEQNGYKFVYTSVSTLSRALNKIDGFVSDHNGFERILKISPPKIRDYLKTKFPK